MKRILKTTGSAASAGLLERLKEDAKQHFIAELAKPDASVDVLANIYLDFKQREFNAKNGAHVTANEEIRRHNREFVTGILSSKATYGIAPASEIFREIVDGHGTISLRSDLDPNADGRVSAAQFYAAARHGALGTILRSLDLNHDGTVTKAEATKALQNAGIKLEGVRGGFDKSAQVLGAALASAGVEFRPITQSGSDGHNLQHRRTRYVAVVPPTPDSDRGR
jgi:hypothetical protein